MHAGKYVYCGGEDGVLYIFDLKGGQLENVLNMSEDLKEIRCIVHHPHRNLIAAVLGDGRVVLWKA